MHLTASSGNLEALKVLATFIENVNFVVDLCRLTPMHYAAICGKVNILRFLAPLMENPNVPANDGRTPIDFAKLHGHDEFARILQSYINSRALTRSRSLVQSKFFFFLKA